MCIRDRYWVGEKFQIGFSGRMRTVQLGTSVEPLYGATKRCSVWAKMPYLVVGTHVDGETGAVGGTPCGAT
eukprot:6033321-Pyramimonas_sp.AAC.1